MRYLIRIDKKSIKKNPDAGSTILRRPIGQPEVYEKYEFKNGIMVNYEKTITQPYENLHTLTPIPLYSYRYAYEDTIIECCHCGETFPANELTSDIYDDGYDRTCPKCDRQNCCELEFEKFNAEEL